MLHTVQRAAVPGVMRAHRAVQSVEIETDRVAARRSSSWSSSAAVLLPARPREQRRGMEHCAGGVKQRSWPLLTIALEPPRRQWPPQRQKVHLRLPRPPRHRRRRSQPQPPVQPPTVMQARRQQYKPTFFAPCLPAQAATPCARSSYAHFVRITGIAAVPPAEAQPAHQGGECCSRGGRWRQRTPLQSCSRWQSTACTREKRCCMRDSSEYLAHYAAAQRAMPTSSLGPARAAWPPTQLAS